MSTLAPPQLTTERLMLTVPSEEDIPALIAYGLRNREHLRRLGPPEPPDAFTHEFWMRRVVKIQAEFAQNSSIRFSVFRRESRAEIIGGVSLNSMVFGAMRGCFMGYHIDEREQGKGLMSEAVRAVIKYAFEELKLHRISANYVPINERSGRLLKRLGFNIEGYARDYLFVGGEWRDHVLTALTNPASLDWQTLCTT